MTPSQHRASVGTVTDRYVRYKLSFLPCKPLCKPQIRPGYGGSRRCLEIISECAFAKSATWSAGYQYLCTLHATLLCLYVLVCSLCRAPAGFVSAMAYRETAIVQDTLSVLGMRCTGLFESYFLLCPESLTNSKHVPAGAVLP